MTKKIGILLVATGKYIQFFQQLHESFETYLFPGTEKIYFVFTDNTDYSFPSNVYHYYQEHEPFPGPTLHRYHYFSKISNVLETFKLDYLFYSDVDMRACNVIDTSILPEFLLGVYHPGFYNTSNPRGTPEIRQISRAYIAPETIFQYIAGGFQGGRTDVFLESINIMRNAIDVDMDNDIIPIWHDESIWNKFMVSNIHLFKFINPEYCFPESWGQKSNLQGLTPRLLALDKNHAELRKH